MGVKRIIYSDKVKHIDVPQFEGLTIQTIFDFAKNDRDVESALPPSKEIAKLSRAYLAKVVYTIMGQKFQDWVDAQVELRNQKIALERNNVIAMDPQIAAIFHQSTAISGKCHPMVLFSHLVDILTCLSPYSVQGPLQPPDEARRPAQEVQGRDPGGEAAGPAAGGRDRREDAEVRGNAAAGR